MISLEGAHVLVVDDEPLIRDMLREEFESEGSKVLEAPNGTDAFNIQTTRHPEVIISDIRMMGGDGVSLLRNVRGKNPEKPIVVLMTGYSDYGLDLLYSMGANAVLGKPYDFISLRNTVNRLLVPEAMRWETPLLDFDPTEVHVLDASYDSYALAVQSGEISIGRGGFFIRQVPRIPINQLVRFQLAFKSGEVTSLSGVAAIRWRRDQDSPDLPAGSGFEFIHLDQSSLPFILKERTKSAAFIPRK